MLICDLTRCQGMSWMFFTKQSQLVECNKKGRVSAGLLSSHINPALALVLSPDTGL